MWPVAAHQDLHRLVGDLGPHLVDASLRHYVAVAEQHHVVGHAVHLVEDVARDHDVQALPRQSLEKGEALRARHGIEAVEGLVQHQHLRAVAQREGEADALAHPLAVGRDLAVGGVRHPDALQRLVGQAARVGRREAVQAEPPSQQRAAGHAARERVVLRAVADQAPQRFAVVGTPAQHGEAPARRAQQAGHQVHERGLPRAVGAHQARDPRRQGQRHAVDAEDLAVELRDVLESDRALAAHETTSRARRRRFRIQTHTHAATVNPIQAPQVGRSRPGPSLNISRDIWRLVKTPNRSRQTSPTR